MGFLAGPPGSRSGQGRLMGHRSVMKASGLAPKDGWVRHCAPVADAGRDMAARLLTEHPELTALLCYNDLVAVGVLRAAAELGRRVPEDLAVVGFDDIPLAALVTPPLTTCRVARHELGVRAVELLLRQIGGEPLSEEPIVLHPELIVRQSAP